LARYEAVVFVVVFHLDNQRLNPNCGYCRMAVGLICGFLIYSFASRTSNFLAIFCNTHTDAELLHTALTIFLIVMTNFVLLIVRALSASRLGIPSECL